MSNKRFEDETDVIIFLTDRVTELKQENKNLEKEIEYLKEKCIDAGKELGKHSFAWDGKEKNLVIQAMELNEMYEKAEQKLEKIKNVVSICLEFRLCNNCSFFSECDGYMENYISQIIEGKENEEVSN